MHCEAYIFLQCKPLFQPHHCGKPHFLLLGYPSQRLFHILQLKDDFPVLHQVVLSGHFRSSHIT